MCVLKRERERERWGVCCFGGRTFVYRKSLSWEGSRFSVVVVFLFFEFLDFRKLHCATVFGEDGRSWEMMRRSFRIKKGTKNLRLFFLN